MNFLSSMWTTSCHCMLPNLISSQFSLVSKEWVTHICARDGSSGKVVEFVSMPVRNYVEIYDKLFQ